MIIRPACPASGAAIRYSFEILMLERLGPTQYSTTLEEIVGKSRYNFATTQRETGYTTSHGRSVRITNSEGRSARLKLQPIFDEDLYQEFEIVVLGLEAEFGHPNPESVELDFGEDLSMIARELNRRILLWVKNKAA